MENYHDPIIKFFNILKSRILIFVFSFFILSIGISLVRFYNHKNTYKTNFFIKPVTFDDGRYRLPKLNYSETEKVISDFGKFLKNDKSNEKTGAGLEPTGLYQSGDQYLHDLPHPAHDAYQRRDDQRDRNDHAQRGRQDR